MIDTSLRIETPEGIDLELHPAGPVPRGLALAVDVLLRGAIEIAAAIALTFAGAMGMGVLLVLVFLLEWFYPVFFEVFRGGQTPGKTLVGLRVINRDATPVGVSASLLRNLLRVADFLPLFYAAGLVSMTSNGRFQRLGDLAAGTLVVHTSSPGPIEPPARESGSEGALLPPVALSPEEQRALLSFAERRGTLSDSRAAELATLLSPLTGKRGEDGVDALLRMADGVAGRR